MKVTAYFNFKTTTPMSTKTLEERDSLLLAIGNVNKGTGVYLDPFRVVTFTSELDKNAGNARQQLIAVAKKHGVTLGGTIDKPDTTMWINFEEGQYEYTASGKKEY